MTKTIVTLVACATLLWVGTAQGVTSDEAKCEAALAKAAGAYENCVQKWLANVYSRLADFDVVTASAKLSKCRIKYAEVWTKVQKLEDSHCSGPRYWDYGNGTVLDNLTGLEWEKKSSDGSIHDRGNQYFWSSMGFRADGNVFTIFLAGLNGGGFAGQYDWRLPTFAEMQTILLPEPFPCATDPCYDSAFTSGCMPGCTVTTCSCPSSFSVGVWSSTSLYPNAQVWTMAVDAAAPSFKADLNPVRAVRPHGGM